MNILMPAIVVVGIVTVAVALFSSVPKLRRETAAIAVERTHDRLWASVYLDEALPADHPAVMHLLDMARQSARIVPTLRMWWLALFIRTLGIDDAGHDHLGDLLGGLTDEQRRILRDFDEELLRVTQHAVLSGSTLGYLPPSIRPTVFWLIVSGFQSGNCDERDLLHRVLHEGRPFPARAG